MNSQNEDFLQLPYRMHKDAEPRPEFVERLERRLTARAREMERQGRGKRRLAYAAGGVGAAAAATLLFLNVPTMQGLVGGMRSADGGTENTHVANAIRANKDLNAKPVVYIYETHNRESFLPELGITNPDNAYDKTKNIRQVGDLLVTALQSNSISAYQDRTDFWTMGPLDQAYQFSRKQVQADLQSFGDHTQVVLDIHRDTQPSKDTTVTVDGMPVARIFFIIGGSNPNAAANEAFAKQLNAVLEASHPGVSRGVWKKASTARSAEMDTTYNQDLHPHSVLVEIGGVENTLEEEGRAVEMLGAALSDVLSRGNQ